MQDTPAQEVRYRLLKFLADHPDATQRELARELGISVGKANYCLRAVMRRGWVKVQNFRNSRNKSAYLYVLTPAGIEEKMSVTAAFLRRQLAEYNRLKEEISRLRAEVEGDHGRVA